MSAEDVSLCLRQLSDGDEDAVARLLPQIYDDLVGMARHIFGRNEAMTLQPTALVHEAYMRLVKSPERNYSNRQHFMRVAAMAMRQLLANHAKQRRALKRGGGDAKEEMHSGIAVDMAGSSQVDLIQLDDALTGFAAKFPRQAQVVELRFLAGLSVEETAATLGVSERTVRNDWQLARAWLSLALSGDEESPET